MRYTISLAMAITGAFAASCASAETTRPRLSPSPKLEPPTAVKSASATTSPDSSQAHSSTPPVTRSPTPDPCATSAERPLVLIADDAFYSLGPTADEIDDALATHFPPWHDFRQTLYRYSWTAGHVFEDAARTNPTYSGNAAVLLTVVGSDLNWQLPSDGDLYIRAAHASTFISPHELAFALDDQIRLANPEAGNAPTYALFRYFARDFDRLAAWCASYQLLFGSTYPLGP